VPRAPRSYYIEWLSYTLRSAAPASPSSSAAVASPGDVPASPGGADASTAAAGCAEADFNDV